MPQTDLLNWLTHPPPVTALGVLSTELELPWVPTDHSPGEDVSGRPLWASQLSKAVSHRLERGQGGCMLTKAWQWDSGLGCCRQLPPAPPPGPCSPQSPPPAMISVLGWTRDGDTGKRLWGLGVGIDAIWCQSRTQTQPLKYGIWGPWVIWRLGQSLV